MPSLITEEAESCYTLQPRRADESFDINSFVKIVLDEVLENLKIENCKAPNKAVRFESNNYKLGIYEI